MKTSAGSLLLILRWLFSLLMGELNKQAQKKAQLEGLFYFLTNQTLMQLLIAPS